MAIDPYRTLGLLPGATPAEVKRAYRRLAKAFHPDSAGPEALPRFLAIQEAYEHLATGRSTGRRAGSAAAGFGGGGGAASAAAGAGPEPWRADPSRAREAREQARGRPPGLVAGAPQARERAVAPRVAAREPPVREPRAAREPRVRELRAPRDAARRERPRWARPATTRPANRPTRPGAVPRGTARRAGNTGG